MSYMTFKKECKVHFHAKNMIISVMYTIQYIHLCILYTMYICIYAYNLILILNHRNPLIG